jgi:hypothetical protein
MADLFPKGPKKKVAKKRVAKKKAPKKKASSITRKKQPPRPIVPTTKKQRDEILAMFKDGDFSPIKKLMELATDEDVDQKERIMILKFLAPYQAPTPKSVDIQADMKMNVSVTLNQFGGITEKDLDDTYMAENPDEDYEEFIEID